MSPPARTWRASNKLWRSSRRRPNIGHQQHLVVTVTDEFRPEQPFNDRQREREWLHLNGPRYAGEWVAIEGDQLVSHGENAKAVLQQAWTAGVQHPLLMHIPKEPPLPFGGW